MPAPVQIDFVSGGIADVLRAFETLESRAEKAERSISTSAAGGSRGREATAKREVDAREKAYQKLVKEVEAQEKAATKAAEKEAAQRTKAVENAAKAATKAAERESKNRQKLAVEEARAEERVFAQSLRERERAAKAATRIEESAAAERLRIAEREASQQEAAARRSSRGYGRSMGSAGLGSVGRTVGGAASLLGGALTVGGGFEVAGALREELTFGKAVAQTANAAFVEGDPTRTREKASPAMIAALAKHVEAGTNISKVDAVEALHKYVNLASDLSGMSEINPATGRSNLEEMGRISKGSGADFGDLMTAAGYLKAQNPDMGSSELNLRMRQMVGAGAKGDIAISDMARYANMATANAGQFAGDLGTNQAKMLGLTQIAGRVSDPAQAAEAVNKLAFDVSKHADKMNAAGARVTDRSGKILDPADVIGNLFQATGGNVGKLSDLGIDARSMKVFEGLQRNYDEAEAVKKGTGAAAVRREVTDYEHVNFSQGSADANFKNVMGSDEEKLSSVMVHFREVVAGEAAPAFERFVSTLADHQSDLDLVIQGIGKLAAALAEDPLGTAAKLMAAKVAADVAQAGIGEAMKHAIEGVFGGVGGASGGTFGGIPTGVSAGGVRGALGVVGAAGAIAVVATGTVELGMATIDMLAGKADKDQGNAVAADLTDFNKTHLGTVWENGKPRAMTKKELYDQQSAQMRQLLAAETAQEQHRQNPASTGVERMTIEARDAANIQRDREAVERTNKFLEQIVNLLGPKTPPIEVSVSGSSFGSDPPGSSRSHPLSVPGAPGRHR